MSCEGCPSKGNCSKDAASCGVQPNPHNKIAHIVPVMSGKGGVGKSTITVLLAQALARKGLKVGIMDADITGPSIPRLLGMEHEKAYATAQNELLPVSAPDGIRIMSLNYLLPNEGDPVIWRGPIVGNVVRQFYTDVLWGELDVLLIDMPPGTGDVALTILQELPVQGVVMVSTPQPMVSMIVTKAIGMCEQMHIPVLGVFENMAWLECPHCQEKILFYDEQEIDAFLKQNHTRLYAMLPMHEGIRSLHDYQTWNLAQQEKTDAFMEKAAAELWSDLTRDPAQQESD